MVSIVLCNVGRLSSSTFPRRRGLRRLVLVPCLLLMLVLVLLSLSMSSSSSSLSLSNREKRAKQTNGVPSDAVTYPEPFTKGIKKWTNHTREIKPLLRSGQPFDSNGLERTVPTRTTIHNRVLSAHDQQQTLVINLDYQQHQRQHQHLIAKVGQKLSTVSHIRTQIHTDCLQLPRQHVLFQTNTTPIPHLTSRLAHIHTIRVPR